MVFPAPSGEEALNEIESVRRAVAALNRAGAKTYLTPGPGNLTRTLWRPIFMALRKGN